MPPPPPLKTPTIQVHARPSIRQKNAEPSILVVYNPIILWASISKTVGTALREKYKKERYGKYISLLVMGEKYDVR